jgi:hypothetical protein
MNTKNLWIAALSGAVLSLLVSNLPLIAFVNCFLFAGFWGSAIFAVWLYRRLSGTLNAGEGVRIGALTGLLAGLIGFALSFVGLAGLQGLMNSAGAFLPADATQSIEEFPAWAAIVFNCFGILFDIGFGALGGWLGGIIFNPQRKGSPA